MFSDDACKYQEGDESGDAQDIGDNALVQSLAVAFGCLHEAKLQLL